MRQIEILTPKICADWAHGVIKEIHDITCKAELGEIDWISAIKQIKRSVDPKWVDDNVD